MNHTETTAELLHLLAGDPAELGDAVAGLLPADVAVLDQLRPEAATGVLAVLPLDLAVQILDVTGLLMHSTLAIPLLPGTLL